MNECKRRLHAVIPKVWEEVTQLGSRKHSLVHKCARRQRREVGTHVTNEFTLDALARHENLAVKVDALCPCWVIEEELLNCWHHGTCGCTQTIWVRWNDTPTKWSQPFFNDDALHSFNCRCCAHWVSRKKCDANGVFTHGRKFKTCNCSQECIGYLNQNSSAIAGVCFCTSSSTMFHVA